jgi:hypothetical protein
MTRPCAGVPQNRTGITLPEHIREIRRTLRNGTVDRGEMGGPLNELDAVEAVCPPDCG